jgi:hypothetical protein
VVRGRDAVRVRGEIVELCGSLMSVIGHSLVSQFKEQLQGPPGFTPGTNGL